MNKLAPVSILAYSRIKHLKQTIESLKKNTLAPHTDLFIFIDGPKKGDEKLIRATSNYVHTIDGFNEVVVVERKTNDIVYNFTNGMQRLFENYGRCIYMDDDIITAPGFLQFMNDALDFSKDRKKLFSVTGYCPPINTDKYCRDDYFVLPRFCSWGFGIWADRYNLIKDVPRGEFENFMKKRVEVIKFILGGGDDMLPMLEDEAYGRIYTTDVKAMFYQFLNNKLTLYPKNSLLFNAGNDGTGLHCGATDKFNVTLWDKIEFNFKHDVQPDPKILKANRKFRSLGIKFKLKLIAQFIGVYSWIKKVRGYFK